MRVLAATGSFSFSLSVFLASFMTSLPTYCIFYGIFFGASIGLAYLPPFKHTYSYFPNRKGMCSGVCMMGYGIGSLMFNAIFLNLVNPDNIAADP